MPPVPTVNTVTVCPFLNIFCTGTCPTLPQIIAWHKWELNQSAKSISLETMS
jgi:hypothetical protein